jgi:RNA polymerase sigma-70 factor, ECF subfamily
MIRGWWHRCAHRVQGAARASCIQLRAGDAKSWRTRCPSRISTWLFEICVRVAHAQRRTDRDHLADVPIEEIGGAHYQACDLIEHKQQMQVLDVLLDELPMEQRCVFVLYELEEMTGEQIAELLDLPIGTVWSRLRLARQAFRVSIHRRAARSHFELAPVRGGT